MDIFLYQILNFLAVDADIQVQILLETGNGDIVGNGKDTENTGTTSVFSKHCNTLVNGILRSCDIKLLALIVDLS